MPGLTVDRLKLGFFRSHVKTDISLDGRPIAIFGSNGAGKTNILEAVSLLSPGRGLRRAAPDELVRRPDNLGWKVHAELTSLGHRHEIETSADPAASRHVRIDGKSATQTALGRVARIIWLVPSMDRLWIEGAEGRRRFLDRMVLSFEPAHAEAVLGYEKAMRERNRLLKDQVQDSHWYSALETRMAAAGEKIQLARRTAISRLAAAQEGAETAFPAATLELIAPEGAETPDLASEFALSLSENRTVDMRAGRTLIGPHRSDLSAVFSAKEVDAAQCSTGEQKALLISLVLSNARALAEDFGAAPIVLLDEVAAHLDSDRRAALYDEICALGAQAWMTGTGPELFEELHDRAQHFEVREDRSGSTVHICN
jgi:DNA replication and repair protein RecF